MNRKWRHLNLRKLERLRASIAKTEVDSKMVKKYFEYIDEHSQYICLLCGEPFALGSLPFAPESQNETEIVVPFYCMTCNGHWTIAYHRAGVIFGDKLIKEVSEELSVDERRLLEEIQKTKDELENLEKTERK